jgi:hypothetical protein
LLRCHENKPLSYSEREPARLEVGV